MTTEKQPNILMIMADQLAPQVLPSYGHALVHAPHIQALADNGVVFENAYTNFPLCVPGRMAMLAGRYANAMEVWDNAAELRAGVPTIAHYLRAQGYFTSLIGKMHFIGPDQMHGYHERLVTDIYPANFAWTPNWDFGIGDRPTGINLSAITNAGTCIRSLQIDYDDEVEYFATQKIYDLVRFSEQQPFFATVSFTHPHSPFITKQKYWDLYDHADIDLPKVAEIPLQNLDEFSRWLYYAHGHDLSEVSTDDIRNARHAYYGNVSYIDEKVGRIIETLTEVGLLEDTVIVFCADHGEMMGERGAWYKQYMFEWSARIPMIVHYPRAYPSTRVSAPVSLVDLLPTFVDIAGGNLTPPTPLDGHSLLPLLENVDAETGWQHPVISEYTGEGTCAPVAMIRDKRYKYIYTHGHPSMLFDLEQDPDELADLIDSPEHQLVIEQLHARLLRDWDPQEVDQRARQNQRERRFIQQTTGGEPNWAYVMRADDDRRFVRNSGAIQTKARARYPFVTTEPIK